MMDSRSIRNLEGVHPDLVRVAELAFKSIAPDSSLSFRVTEGVRSKERQQKLFADNKSKTLKSRHVPESNACGLSCAIDIVAIVGGQVSWEMKYYEVLAFYFKAAAAEINVPITWGGDWKTFKDGPHFQLSEDHYPLSK